LARERLARSLFEVQKTEENVARRHFTVDIRDSRRKLDTPGFGATWLDKIWFEFTSKSLGERKLDRVAETNSVRSHLEVKKTKENFARLRIEVVKT
jgi:hypothetical protein